MDEKILEIIEFNGEGYKPLVDFGCWRVAFLRYLDELRPDHITAMERHTQTDEVFVLLQGRVILLIGGNGSGVDKIQPQVMEPARLYNVKRNTWHGVLLSQDATILLVENRDTGTANSEYTPLTDEQKGTLLEIARDTLAFDLP